MKCKCSHALTVVWNSQENRVPMHLYSTGEVKLQCHCGCTTPHPFASLGGSPFWFYELTCVFLTLFTFPFTSFSAIFGILAFVPPIYCGVKGMGIKFPSWVGS